MKIEKFLSLCRTTMKISLVLSVTIVLSGCLSAWSYKCSEDEIAQKRLVASGDRNAIKLFQSGVPARSAIRAVQLGNGGVGIGLDITALDALSEHPWRQLGAALGDAALLYGAYAGVESMNNSNNDSSEQTAGRDNNTTTVNGDGNTVNVGTTSSQTPVVVQEGGE